MGISNTSYLVERLERAGYRLTEPRRAVQTREGFQQLVDAFCGDMRSDVAEDELVSGISSALPVL